MNPAYWVCIAGVGVLTTTAMGAHERSPKMEAVCSLAALTFGFLAILLLLCGVRCACTAGPPSTASAPG